MVEIFLTIVIHFGGGAPRIMEYPMDNMEQCLVVLKETKIHTPTHADENEWIGTATCGKKMELRYK